MLNTFTGSRFIPSLNLSSGCGTGDILFQCYEFGNTDSGLGVDLSETGIEFAKKFASVNNYHNLDFQIGDISFFDNYNSNSFDGIRCYA